MISFISFLENSYNWLEFGQLPKTHQEAVSHAIRIYSDEVSEEDVLYRLERISIFKALEVFRSWGWPTSIAGIKEKFGTHSKPDIDRVKKIKSKKRWPYVQIWSNADTFDKWAQSSEHHGDGWHRVVAAGERGELYIDFVFMKLKS